MQKYYDQLDQLYIDICHEIDMKIRMRKEMDDFLYNYNELGIIYYER